MFQIKFENIYIVNFQYVFIAFAYHYLNAHILHVTIIRKLTYYWYAFHSLGNPETNNFDFSKDSVMVRDCSRINVIGLPCFWKKCFSVLSHYSLKYTSRVDKIKKSYYIFNRNYSYMVILSKIYIVIKIEILYTIY